MATEVMLFDSPEHGYTRRTNDEAICLAVLLFYVLPRHTNTMTNKVFKRFDKCDARCVHLFPQEEECIFNLSAGCCKIKSLYSPQSLLVSELKFLVKKVELFTVTKFCMYPTPACCTGKMLFANASKSIRNWLLTLQPDNYLPDNN